MKRVVFVDRDGTILHEPKDKQVDTLEKLEFVPGIISGLKLLADSGFTLVMVSNQDGLGTSRYPKKAFRIVQEKVLRLLEGEGVCFEKIFICPHRTADCCRCRKPKTGLVDRYLRQNAIDRDRSSVLGDRETDVLFAKNIGIRSVRLTRNKKSQAEYATSDALSACRYIARASRSARMRRTTNETDISVGVSLDGSGTYDISTGIGFFDHMLAQLARHSRIDLQVAARGDLGVDEHHSVEDVGIVLGETIRHALGDKRGIARYAFTVPMDESTAHAVLDLSGRRFLSFKCSFARERVGELPTELVEDFFRAFVDGLGATLHISCTGRNDHHKIEALFKALALTLRNAIQIDQRTRTLLPTTKGRL
jgi:imidazoleglycerol-phosphate dehydratase/histidinol-phosphatase